MGESDTQIKKCTSRNHIESFELFYGLKKNGSPFVDFCALISVKRKPCRMANDTMLNQPHFTGHMVFCF